MKFNFRKIASVVASAVMLGSTVGVAAAASYPGPFVTSGVADVAIVYGSNAAVSDLSAAIDAQTNLQSKATSTSGTTASTTGGDSVSLASSSQQLYMGSALNAARTILTKDHMPTLLADGVAHDLTGTEYKYTQTITPMGGARKITYSKSGESIDPDLLVDTGYQASSLPLYNYSLTFSKAINITDTTNVVGHSAIDILGNSFTIGANSDNTNLYLYGSGTTVTVDEGETTTVSVGGKDHTISLVGSSSTTTATVEVDGIRKTMTTGNSYKFADGFEVFFKSLFHATKTGTLSSADLLVGSRSLHLINGQAVRYGTDDTSILGTHATLTIAGGALSQIVVGQSAESSLGDFIKTGESYTDRVFGNLAIENVGPVPALDATTRDSVVVDTDQSVAARVTFTTALANGEEHTLLYARDSDNTEDSSLSAINLAYENNFNISVREGQAMRINEYLFVNDNDEGRILRVDQIPTGTSTNDYVRLTDVITGDSYDFSTGLNNATTSARTIGGSEYHATVTVDLADTANSTVALYWGAGSSATSVGTQTTLFPRIKLANGQWLAILDTTTLTNNSIYQVPGNYLLATYKSGSTFVDSSTTNTLGNVVYNTIWSGATGTLSTITLNGATCNFSRALGPAVLLVEEKTLADANGHAICVPLTSVTSGTTTEPAVGTPVLSDAVAGTFANASTLQSDTFKRKHVDVYGTLIERDTSTGTNNMVTISYPDEQMYVDVFFKTAEATITPGSEGSGGGGTVLIVKDSEISSVSDKHLVVVGGSCINTVARKIIDPDATSPICGADFTAKTNVGPGQYLLKATASPYNEDKTAMLVAGYEAPQTVSGIAKLKEGHATDVGTENIYPVTAA